VEEGGPLRGRVVISAAYEWPTYADGDQRACSGRAAQTATATVRTAVSLVAGDPVVAVETTLDNRCRDHRLRVHFPLPEPAGGSDAGCAFAVVHRGLHVECGASETPPATFPARRFVDCGGLALISDGTFEYEVCDDGRELAVTLLRATGWLSRRRLPLRPDPAGPAVPVVGAQVQGERRWRYGLLLHAGGWEAADVAGRAGAFLDPLEAVAVTATGRGSRPSDGRALRVAGAEVSAVRRDRGGIVVRLFNSGSQPGWATVGEERVDLRPGGIVTVRAGRRPPPG
jgi:alpha-mannosidase